MSEIFITSSYVGIGYDDLLVFALFNLTSNSDHQSVTFEDLVARCFELFPKRFQLAGYPQWPDSSLVNKSWLRCRSDSGMISGSKSAGFILTEKGTELAYKIAQKLIPVRSEDNNKILLKGDRKTKSGRIVKHIESSTAFNKFLKDKTVDRITDFEFCDLLYTTLDTVPIKRKRNLEELKFHIKNYEREDLMDFLRRCEQKFFSLLFENRNQYEGGMMRRKKK